MIKVNNYNMKKITFELILLFLVFFTLFVPNEYSKRNLAVILVVYAIFTYTFFRKAETFSINYKKVFIQIVVFACMYVIIYYFIGIYSGFYRNPVTVDFKVAIKYVIYTSLIIISSEIIRHTFVLKKDKISSIIVTVTLILVDIVLYAQMYDMTNIEDVLAVLGLVIFSSIAENLLFNYINRQFSYKPIIIYRLITTLYSYIIPILPEMYTYFRTIIRIIYPYLIYLFLQNMYNPKKIIIDRYTKTKRVASSLCVIFIAIMVALLVSCKFYIGILAIGSNSMKGSIDKGDAIVYVKNTNKKLKVGDVIVFTKYNIRLVHRIVSIENVNNELRFTTKGDNNETNDQAYVVNEDIIGISKLRIKYIGYPSILLGEFFNSIKR